MLSAIFWVAFIGTFALCVVSGGKAYWAIRQTWDTFRWNLRGRRPKVKFHQHHHWGRW